MHDASLAALRLTIRVSLDRARRELGQRHDELPERRAEWEQRAVALTTLLTERARWQERLRGHTGHILTSLDVVNLFRCGRVIEALLRQATRRRDEAERALARASEALAEARRVVGEHLVRLRWIEGQTLRGDEARERQVERRDDED